MPVKMVRGIRVLVYKHAVSPDVRRRFQTIAIGVDAVVALVVRQRVLVRIHVIAVIASARLVKIAVVVIVGSRCVKKIPVAVLVDQVTDLGCSRIDVPIGIVTILTTALNSASALRDETVPVHIHAFMLACTPVTRIYRAGIVIVALGVLRALVLGLRVVLGRTVSDIQQEVFMQIICASIPAAP
jgi:hypothetical protein